MTREADTPARASGRLRADKRAAILAGGREVFARDGFARASIDAIATVSGVSTRTIYKHFADKSALFAAVIAESATRIADVETALIERRLGGVATVAGIEPALLGFATEWLTGTSHTATHRALVGQIRAEAAHLSPEVVAAWWQAGPGRVISEFAAVITRWDAAGLLDVPQPERAAVQFSRLVAATPGPPASALSATERETWIADGVRVFVRGFRAA